ncbi:PHD and RING finger domain-containing protein 1 isoform X2 [Sitophilus oryzae]|uniref:PHD and RING finger domain-containing protein 1 isoform X2 n=1 Tax=Sitophilus oryzae TaxID=7048 RepID=A0A6J2YWI8_SITOR|nr:PHD and RING finger domain-containing protein 1 isoform X2 [Sitophilus oryzae]
MSSDESEVYPHKRKRKIRRLPDDSPASTSSGSPILGSTSCNRRNRAAVLNISSDSNNSDISELIAQKRKRLISNSDSSLVESDSSPLISKRSKKLKKVIISTSDSSSDSDSDIITVRKTKNIAPLSMTDSESESEWESESGDEISKKSGNSNNIVPEEKCIDSDSSDGQSEKCPICLLSFRLQEIGIPENCEHNFCLECIQEWSKNMNTCPVDRKEYNLIIVKNSLAGNVINQIYIEKPEIQNEMNIIEDPTFCEICGSNEHEDRLLLCDGCDLGFHLYCLNPPLDEVPDGAWYCNECGPGVNLNIDMEEVAGLYEDAEEHFGQIVIGHRRQPSARLIPRTRQSERVRRRILNNRNERYQLQNSMEERASTSTEQLAGNIVSSSTGLNRKKKRQKKKRRKSKKPRYQTVYVLDSLTGEAVPVKKLVKRKSRKRRNKRKSLPSVELLKNTVKKRLSAQLGICVPKNVPQFLPDVKIANEGHNSIRHNRHVVGIPNVDLFGTQNRLDNYYSHSDDEDIFYRGSGGEVSTLSARRVPNASDAMALRRNLRRKTVINVPTVSSSTDVLGSIMQSQEKMLSRNSIMTVDSAGKLKIENKGGSILNNNTFTKPNFNSYVVKKTPYGNSTNTGGGGGYSSNQDWSNSRMYHSVNSQDTYYGASSSNYNQASNVSGTDRINSDDQTNDVPQDYTQRTLCEAELLQEAEEKGKNTPDGSTPISESELDIYSDIENETVSTSKVDDDFKPPSPPNSPIFQTSHMQSKTPNTDEDNDSESGMVIDTEKVSEEIKEPVTSTVEYSEQLYSPEQPTSSPGYITYSPGEPTDSPTQSLNQSTNEEPPDDTEIQSETVQSTEQTDINSELTENKPQLEKPDDDEDSNDGCPNFSIYSRTSKTVALTTDITLAPSTTDITAPNSTNENIIQSSITSANESVTQPFVTDSTVNDESKSTIKESMESHLPLNSNVSLEKAVFSAAFSSIGVLYSDSEDESVVKKNGSFAISDIKDMTEDILSEEERSYTPLLDEKTEKPKEGLEGLDTELISDEDRNDFDESHDLKTISDGDALEINAKESELDLRPEDFEEGEIVDKNKEKVSIPTTSSDPDQNKEIDEDEGKNIDDDKKEESVSKKKKKNPIKDVNDLKDKNSNKENENKRSSFKKLSRTNKDRNYRDTYKSRSKSKDRELTEFRNKSPDKNARKETKRKKEKRRELERYNVRALIADKPRPPPKDQFGRDLRHTVSRSRSRSKSYTPPIVHRSQSPSINEIRRSSSKRNSRSTSRKKSVSKERTHRSVSRDRTLSNSKDKTHKRKARSRNRKSESRLRSNSGRRRTDRSKYKKRKRSRSKTRKRNKSKERYRTKSKKRLQRSKSRSNSRIRSRSRSLSTKRRRHDWTPSFSRSPSLPIRHISPSWTPPRVDNTQALRNQNLTVILNNKNNNAAKKRKKDKRSKEKKGATSKKRRRDRERTPPPSKEVFASGDNILVSVSFNSENETRDVTTRERRRKEIISEDPKKNKDRRVRNKRDLTGVKPVAIIDLERSPFQEILESPKDIIVLSDSDNNETDNRNIQNICDSSQQVASPERTPTYSMGPKTPPEPSVKFSLLAKPPQLRAISNPLHEPDEAIEEDMQPEMSSTTHKGPNTPPEEPPTSPPSSPDAYDPYEPTKSRSPTPEPLQLPNCSGNEQSLQESLDNKTNTDNILEKTGQTPDVLKSLTPPIADIQPADSQSSIQEISDSKSPDQQQRIGVVINQTIQPANSKPVAQTIPFSSVPTSIVTSTPVSTSLSTSRINFLSSTVITLQSNIPQRIVLPNQVKSSPVKISPTKAAVKSTPIKPMQLKSINKSKKNTRNQNGTNLEDVNLDFDSPYSPGSSDYDDLFEPPSDPPIAAVKAKSISKPKSNSSQKHQSTFDTLFGSPNYNKKKNTEKRIHGSKKNVLPTKTKQIGVKIDEDSLKILEDLPNSAVEMQVKDKFLKKLNRQERVVEEVKLVLKPYYNKKKITKDEYKDIMRRAVPKICHNKSGEINPIKIRTLIEAYVKKIKHSKKVTSSSSLPQKVV